MARARIPALLLLVVAVCAGAARADDAPDVRSLSWLSGAWISERDGRVFEEIWSEPGAERMVGVNHTVAGGSSRAFEFLRVERREGRLFLVASPGGRSPGTAFGLVEEGEARVVFENPDHDFPQRISYEREGDVLRARIEGVVDGRTRATEWRYVAKGAKD